MCNLVLNLEKRGGHNAWKKVLVCLSRTMLVVGEDGPLFTRRQSPVQILSWITWLLMHLSVIVNHMQEPRINPVLEVIKNQRDSHSHFQTFESSSKVKAIWLKKKKKDSKREEFPRCRLVPWVHGNSQDTPPHRSHAKETYLTALSQSQLGFLKVIFPPQALTGFLSHEK